MKVRVAVTSSDGKVMKLHHRYFIFPISAWSAGSSLSGATSGGYLGHDTAECDKVRLMLWNREAVLVGQSSPAAAAYLLEKGPRVFQAPYRLDHLRFTGKGRKNMKDRVYGGINRMLMPGSHRLMMLPACVVGAFCGVEGQGMPGTMRKARQNRALSSFL